MIKFHIMLYIFFIAFSSRLLYEVRKIFDHTSFLPVCYNALYVRAGYSPFLENNNYCIRFHVNEFSYNK